jgi:hypothetical protein
MRPTPLAQKLRIAPIFIADKVSLTVSREKDGKLRIVYAGWDDYERRSADGCGQARRGVEWRILPPAAREAVTPLVKIETPGGPPIFHR